MPVNSDGGIPSACQLVVANGSIGSGFLTSPDTLITCAHTLRMMRLGDIIKIHAKPGAEAKEGKILKIDEATDLALVKLANPAPDIECLPLHLEEPRIGSPVYVHGFPKFMNHYPKTLDARFVQVGVDDQGKPALHLRFEPIDSDTRLDGLSGAPVCCAGKVIGVFRRVPLSPSRGPQASTGFASGLGSLNQLLVGNPPPPPPPGANFEPRYWVPRPIEEQTAISALAPGHGAFVLVCGAEGIGKSWYVNKLLGNPTLSSYPSVHFNVQLLPGSVQKKYQDLIKHFALNILKNVGVAEKIASTILENEFAQNGTSANDSLLNIMEKQVLSRLKKQKKAGIILAIDRVDFLVKGGHYDDFTKLLLSFKARASRDANWQIVRSICSVRGTLPEVIAINASVPKHNAVIELQGFQDRQIEQLAEQYHLSLTKSEVTELKNVTDGHPERLRQEMYKRSPGTM